MNDVPEFLRSVGIERVTLKNLEGATAYLWPLSVQGERVEGKKCVMIDARLSDSEKLVALIHEYLHALYGHKGTLVDSEAERFVTDQEQLVVDLLQISTDDWSSVGKMIHETLDN